MKTFLSLSAMATAATATVGLLVPMYEYPYGDDAISDWNALITAIDAYPALPFYVIINIDSGAPFSTDPPQGLQDFAEWIDALNSRSNAKSIGYIHTGYGSRDSSLMIEGVSQYANWTTSAGRTTNETAYNVRLDGIFFDEVTTDPAKLQYNTDITTFAKSSFKSQGGPIVLNPGVTVQSGSEALFDAADSILQMETCYTNSSGATDPGGYERCASGTYAPFTPALLDTLGSEAQKAKSSVVVHDFYESWAPYSRASLSSLQDSITATVNSNVHSFYFSLFGYTGNFTQGPASIINVATYAARAQGLQ